MSTLGLAFIAGGALLIYWAFGGMKTAAPAPQAPHGGGGGGSW